MSTTTQPVSHQNLALGLSVGRLTSNGGIHQKTGYQGGPDVDGAMPPCQSALIDVMCSAAARLLQPPGRHVLKWDTEPCRQGPVRGRKTRRPLWLMCWLVLSSSCPVILVDGGFSARRVWAKRHFPKVDKQVLLTLSRTARCKSEVPCKGPCLARCFSAVVASILFLSYDGRGCKGCTGCLEKKPS